jgi:hypothetical protein
MSDRNREEKQNQDHWEKSEAQNVKDPGHDQRLRPQLPVSQPGQKPIIPAFSADRVKRRTELKMRNPLIAVAFLISAVVIGFAAQEESGACLPEHHQAEQENKLYCHCVAMGGFQNCDPKTGHYSYQKWVEENRRRQQDIDPKTKKPREKQLPKCRMSCKEDHCECCAYMNQFRDKRKAEITISYDNY